MGKHSTTNDASDIIQTITKSLTKKGKIKGRNKKETKMLTYACPHNKLNKKGEIVPQIETVGKMLRCRMCHAEFSGHIYMDDEIRKMLKNTMYLINQMKFMMPALKADKDTQRFVTQLAVSMEQVPKIYHRIRKVADKRTEMQRKKKNKQNRDNDGYGSWRACK